MSVKANIDIAERKTEFFLDSWNSWITEVLSTEQDKTALQHRNYGAQ